MKCRHVHRPSYVFTTALLVVLAFATMPIAGAAFAYVPVFEGNCGDLDTELTDDSAHLFVSEIGVYTCYFLPEMLSPGGLDILTSDTQGGSATYSKVLAFELLAQCDQASLIKTEDEIIYSEGSGSTDALLSLGTTRIGLSVTRGIVYPIGAVMTVAQAQAILENQLQQVLLNTANVSPDDAWQKQILMVETPLSEYRASFEAAYALIDDALKSNTIVWIVQTDIEWDFIYSGSDPICVGTDVDRATPRIPRLAQNLPNPFNPQTLIRFELGQTAHVRLQIYDDAGRPVATLVNGPQDAGLHEVIWNGRGSDGQQVASGVYLYQLQAGEFIATKRMVLLK